MEFINSAKNKVPKLFEKEILKLYPKGFKDLDKLRNQSLFLYGKPGTGKTLQAISCCLKQRSDKKLIWKSDFKFMNVSELLYQLRSSYNCDFKNEISFEEKTLNKCRNVGILILDDLGVEKSSDWALQILYLIINYRYENEKLTIVTSNYSPDKLQNKMEDGRIISRLCSMGLIIHCQKQYRNV